MNGKPDLEHGKQVHLVGIGGMHMSAIAQILAAGGIAVSGCDLTPSPLTRRLEGFGVRVYAGHGATHLRGCTLLVTTAAVKGDNVEIAEARRLGIPVLLRHEMVARLMAGRRAVAVAGTHGKTTTSSLVALMLERAGLNPGYLLGGESIDLGGNAGAGTGQVIVVEADEYAGAFLAYYPSLAIVTNIEVDHLDYFGSQAELLRAFRRFVDNVPPDGVVVACADSPLLRQILGPNEPPVAARLVWYGLDQQAEWMATSIALHEGSGGTFTVVHAGKEAGSAVSPLPGRHNVSNTLAAFAAGTVLGIAPESMLATIAAFHGARRRFELAGEAAGITVIDDYAHHPTEIEATLAAARSRYPGRRLVVLFQPHTYSRTQYLLDGFRECFGQADVLVLLQTFAARETAGAGLDAHALASSLSTRPAGVAQSVGEAVHLLMGQLRPGDVCLTMGAGDVTTAGGPLIEELRRR